MGKSVLIGIDLGKHSFHLHGQDGSGREVFRKKLSRAQMMQFFGNLPSCVVVMEACAGVALCRSSVGGNGTHGQADFPAVRWALRQVQQK